MSAVFTPPRVKLTVDRYEKMGEAGIFGDDHRIELIEGELVEMAPIGGPHLGVVNALTALLTVAVGRRGVVSVQNPVGLLPYSEPQPDLVVLKPGFAGRNVKVPRADDALLVIEVADTTLHYDRNVKVKIYARAGIPEVWLVDVNAGRVEVFREPSAEGYAKQQVAEATESVTMLALPDVEIVDVDLLRIAGDAHAAVRRVARAPIVAPGRHRGCLPDLVRRLQPRGPVATPVPRGHATRHVGGARRSHTHDGGTHP